MRRVRIPPFRFPVQTPYRELKEGHNRVRQWKTPGRAPVPETDFFHQWEIPLEAYKGIGPGPRFIPVHNEPPFVSQHLYRYLDSPLPSHPQLESLPAPPESSATSAATLNRALVVKGILDKDLSHVLLKIHQGPLEFSRLDQEEQLLSFMPRTHALTLSFLSSNSAHAFVNAHLSDPARLYEFARSFDPTWEWLPATPLPPSVTHALQAHTARRALSIAWLAFADRYLGDVRDFGAVQYRWQYGPGRLVVHYYAIADAIRAHAELRTNPKLRVSFFPDWCELSTQGRDVLMEHGRLRKGLLSTHGAWMVNWSQHWGRLLNIVEHGPKRLKPPKDAETPSDPSSVSAEEFLKWYLTQVGIGLAGARRIVDIPCAILRIALSPQAPPRQPVSGASEARGYQTLIRSLPMATARNVCDGGAS
ncbi:hypothetical protein B0H14DRAFT_1244075 [Mycena olivaceomarginata]|nr:hypothetical protein B0H14DRAFT_1244075 [Mycena olivaceomarginata]